MRDILRENFFLLLFNLLKFSHKQVYKASLMLSTSLFPTRHAVRSQNHLLKYSGISWSLLIPQITTWYGRSPTEPTKTTFHYKRKQIVTNCLTTQRQFTVIPCLTRSTCLI